MQEPEDAGPNVGVTPDGTANNLNSRKVTREQPERSQMRMRPSREDIPIGIQGSMEAPGLKAAEWKKNTKTQLYIKINEFGGGGAGRDFQNYIHTKKP